MHESADCAPPSGHGRLRVDRLGLAHTLRAASSVDLVEHLHDVQRLPSGRHPARLIGEHVAHHADHRETTPKATA